MAVRPDPEYGAWIREAVARFEGPLAIYATRLLGDAESARDVVQDTFLRLCSQERNDRRTPGRMALHGLPQPGSGCAAEGASHDPAQRRTGESMPQPFAGPA